MFPEGVVWNKINKHTKIITTSVSHKNAEKISNWYKAKKKPNKAICKVM